MDFRTIVPIKPFETKLLHASRCMMLGSCFTENMGERLHNAKFSVDMNPFGILYNPFSIEKAISYLLDNHLFESSELVEHGGKWHSFMHHSRFSDIEQSKCLEVINNRILLSSRNLREADFLFVTFGTAWVYELKETGAIVSNCHKLPDSLFNRRRLAVEEIADKYTLIINRLIEYNPKLQVVFTVSPIRHWKDGAHENQLSKSILLLAIDALVQQFDDVKYFPAYELMMDDLRDYRFYTEDMLHPNNVAVNYIWERFSETYFSDVTKRAVSELEKFMKSLAHRPFNKDGEEYERFCKQQLAKIEGFEKKYPEIDFEQEKKKFLK